MSIDGLKPLSQPELTVVIPAHDRADVVTRAVQSVIEQHCELVEIIVIDDGSSDATAEVVERLEDRRVRVVRTTHQGVSAARNTGVTVARSQFVAFLDSDDLARSGWVTTMLEASRARFDLFSCASLEHAPDGSAQVMRPLNLGPAFAGLHAQVQAGAFGLRREVFERAGGYLHGLRHGEGTQLLLAIARLHAHNPLRVGTCEEPLVSVFRRPRPYDAALYYESGIAALRAASDMLRRDASMYARYLAITGVAASRLGRRRQALKLLAQAVMADPCNPRHLLRLLRAALMTADRPR